MPEHERSSKQGTHREPGSGSEQSQNRPAGGSADGLDSSLDAETLRARQERSSPGREAPGRIGQPADGVLVQVCLTCGKEYSFEAQPPPQDLCCEKCGQQVFRSFFEVTSPDEAHEDFRTTTERDLAPDDAESDVMLGDILDLNNP